MKKIHLTLLLLGIAFILYMMKECAGAPNVEELRLKEKNKAAAINGAVEQCLDDFGFKKEWVRRKVIKNKTVKKHLKLVKVPIDLPFPILNLAIKSAVADSGGMIFSGREISGKNRLILTIGYENVTVDSIVLTKDRKLTHKKGKIALIIDDFGTNKAEILERYLKLPEKITFSIIPGSKYAEEIGRLALKSGKEVLIHLPMESHEAPEKNEKILLKNNSKKRDAEKLINLCIKELPMAKGFSNHMGSKATENAVLMKYVADILRKKHLYFVDSRTSELSRAYEVFRKSRNKVLKRDVFLDNVETEEFILSQLEELMRIASENGSAVGIGHETKEITYGVLQKEIPRMLRKGYELIFISEMPGK